MGAPWVILEQTEPPPTISPRLEAEALFNTVGLVRVSEEEAVRAGKEREAVRIATGVVWRQIMLPAFDRAVSETRAILHARIGAPYAPFGQLPADLWPVLEVVDWQNGTAVDPNDFFYYAIHVRSAPSLVSTAAGESAAVKALGSQLRSNPELTRGQAQKWCAAAGIMLGPRSFQQRVWPRARALAGLPERATPGRPRKA